MEPDSLFIAGEAAKVMEREPAAVARLGQIVTPEQPAHGRGYRAGYSFRNLVEMRLAEEFSRLGVSQKRIQRALVALRHSHGRWLEKDGADGYVLLDSLGRWSAGATFDLALYPLTRTIAVASVIAVNLALVKTALRHRLANEDRE